MVYTPIFIGILRRKNLINQSELCSSAKKWSAKFLSFSWSNHLTLLPRLELIFRTRWEPGKSCRVWKSRLLSFLWRFSCWKRFWLLHLQPRPIEKPPPPPPEKKLEPEETRFGWLPDLAPAREVVRGMCDGFVSSRCSVTGVTLGVAHSYLPHFAPSQLIINYI